MDKAPTWNTAASTYRSAGLTAAKAQGLHDLARRRAETQGQHFTPDDVAALMWDIGIQALCAHDKAISVLDNSIGSGRLIQFARPGDYVAGVDTDGAAVAAVSEAIASTDIDHDLRHAGMEEILATGFDLAVINPPFSLTLSSPLLANYPCCAPGRFGPHSSAPSHWYALHQAVEAARVVVALMPQGAEHVINQFPDLVRRLHSVVRLPEATFLDEGARVSTAVLVFAELRPSGQLPVVREGLVAARNDLDEVAPKLDSTTASSRPRFERHGIAESSPVVRLPRTGNNTVRIVRSGRRLKLRFACGLTEAKVMNALLESRLGHENHMRERYPAGIQYVGSARLLVDVLLSGPNPFHFLDRLCRLITAAGGAPDPCRQLVGFFARRWRELQVERTPLQRTIFDKTAGIGAAGYDGANVIATKVHLVNPQDFGSALIRAGAAIKLEAVESPSGNLFRYAGHPTMPALSEHELRDRVELPVLSATGAWRQIEKGRAYAFPHRAACAKRRFEAAGIPGWLGDWPFQAEDIIELTMTRGAIAGHQMALGKSRIALGCCLMGGKHNLLVVEAGLIDEMRAQIEATGLDPELWQVITSASEARALRRVNVISYHTLRAPIAAGAKRTIAHLLSRRLHTVCADEGSILAHSSTDQTKALSRLRCKRRIPLDGTPIPNLPRNLLPVSQWALGDGTPSQPYGRRGPFITPALFDSAYTARRGLDQFAEDFIVTEWVTHTFADDLQTGGKREIPSLKNLDAYRAWVGVNVLRRLRAEPACAPYVRVDPPSTVLKEIDWDDEHLSYVLDTAESFVEWWRSQRQDQDARKLNMATVLLRLQATCRATAVPQDHDGPVKWAGGLTSKQRWAVDTLTNLEQRGATTLCFVASPVTAELIAAHLRASGITALTYTGSKGRKQRTRELNELFRSGAVRTIILTYGVGARGLNLPQASHVVLYDRRWTPRQEQQAIDRAQRNGRTGTLNVIFGHLVGSVDEYQAQMVAYKSDTAAAGLDFAEPELSSSDFKHWMTIIDEFCESIGRARVELIRRNSTSRRSLAA